ncbi:hypothetical protein [Microbacterium paraoxydans]|uniref:hypothetical protein n=1 Tax=Microbacterium paraoxydans TaxID=199592 RepID=UPI0021A30F33|nr:hypothetical protein [Microbacterium paraoxydans]MCT2222491.1 hypothetical protein [Microbacterium paraoxydans]
MMDGHALLDNTSASVTEAQTASGLVDGVIDGHADADDDQRLLLRARFLAEHANAVQATILADVAHHYDLDEDALTVLLHDRVREAVAFDRWDSDIPLILISTGYTPFTDRPRPVGDSIVWLDPSTETSFLRSISSIGPVTWFVADAA